MAEELTIDQIDDLDDEFESQDQSGNEDLSEEPSVDDNYYADNGYDDPEPQYDYDEDEDDSEDVLDMFLRSKGINDASAIKFQDDYGNMYSKNWNDLTAEEQYNILNGTTQTDEETALDEYEIGLINELRRSKLTPNEFVESLKKNSIDQYIKSQETDTYDDYDFDSLTDDEIYALDLQSRIENITDDEIYSAVENAKNNPELYEKQVAGIRAEYNKLMEDNRNQVMLQQQQIQQQREQAMADSIIDSIGNLSSLNLPIELDYNDLEQIADHVLEKDITGTTAFGRAFSNPDSIAKMAFYNMYGDRIINDIVTYFQDEISRVSQAQYDRGFNAGQQTYKAPARFAYRPANTNPVMDYVSNLKSNDYTIDDLDS